MFLGDYTSLALTWAVAVLLVTVVVRWWRSDVKLPPGPKGLPIVGYLPFIGSNMAETARKLSQRYKSDVIALPIGQKTFVFLNSEKTVSKAFASNLFPDRPDYAVKKIHRGRGLLSSDGERWHEQRRLSAYILRDLGVGKLRSETKIGEEIQELMKELSKGQGKPRDVKYLLRTAVTNVISSILFDKRYDYDDKTFVNYFRVFSDSLKHVRFVMLLDIFPFLNLVPGDLFRFHRLLKNEAILAEFFGKHVDDHVTSFDAGNTRDFVDAYISQLSENNLNDENRLQLIQLVGDLFKAGGETVTGTLRWGILYMATHPDIQRKVQEELDSVSRLAKAINPDIQQHIQEDPDSGNRSSNSESEDGESMRELPRLADKKHLVYTQAVLLEIQRFSAVSVLGTPHCNLSNDVEFYGYRIPAGTPIFGNQWAIFRDSATWLNPDEFDPRNFLTESGDLQNQDKLLNFGVGRRRCIGEPLAKMMLFLVFSAMMQRFKFSLLEGVPAPNMEGIFSIIREPAPFEVVIRDRKTTNVA